MKYFPSDIKEEVKKILLNSLLKELKDVDRNSVFSILEQNPIVNSITNRICEKLGDSKPI